VVTRKADLAAEAWSQLLRLFFARKDRVADLANAHDLTPGHLQALMSLDPNEPLSMKALADSWRCDASNVTFLVDRLEAHDLARREVSSSDRRVKTVVLTAKGEAARDKIQALLLAPPEAMLTLSTAELKTLAELLRKLDGDPIAPGSMWSR
jgi:DNA-binding MarR family transcriptional regulator